MQKINREQFDCRHLIVLRTFYAGSFAAACIIVWAWSSSCNSGILSQSLCRDENSVRSLYDYDRHAELTAEIITTITVKCRTGEGLECKSLYRRATVLGTGGAIRLVHATCQQFPGAGLHKGRKGE